MTGIAASSKIIVATLFLIGIWVLACASFFEIRTSLREIQVGNQTLTVEDKIWIFRDDAFGNLTITSILGPIAGASASILAIVFAISNLIVSNISERYSPYVLKIYEEEGFTKKTLYIFASIVGFSVILLFIHGLIPSLISFILLMSTITGFMVALFLLMDYFFYMFKIVNPLKFGEILKNRTIQVVERQNEKEVQEYITSLGVVAARAFDRKELRICTLYIGLLCDVFKAYMELRKQRPEQYRLSAERLGTHENRNCVLVYILDEYFRIFKYSILEKEAIV